MTDPNPEPTVALLDEEAHEAYEQEIADALYDAQAWQDADWQTWEDGQYDDDPNPYHGDDNTDMGFLADGPDIDF